jgi:hypothetical protein
MTSLRADESVTRLLRGVSTPVEITDHAGKVLGVFAPGDPEEARLRLHAWLTLDPAQVQRQKQAPEKTYTTQEVLDYLKSLKTR